jgi:hypothetical protein
MYKKIESVEEVRELKRLIEEYKKNEGA